MKSLIRKNVIYCFYFIVFFNLCSCSSSAYNKTKARNYYGHNHNYQQARDSGPIVKSKININNIPDAMPKVEPKSSIGNPKTYKVFNKKYKVLDKSNGYKAKGLASWYGNKFHGFKTSSGEIYDMYAMSAAHKTLPLPTYAKVTNLENGRHVIVKINDRGPFCPNRLIDLSYAAAGKLGFLNKGIARVEVQAIDPRNYTYKKSNKFKPANSPNSNSNSTYYSILQFGVFKEKKNAEQLAFKLKKFFGYPVRIKKSFSKGNFLFKVHVGPIHELHELDKLKQNILEKGLPKPLVIVNHNS